MERERLNCWEFSRCGREPGGDRVDDMGVCPAAADTSFDGINRGVAGGRICWAVAGTFCGGRVQGTFAEKRSSCMDCDFFKTVLREEGASDSQRKFLRFLFREGREPVFKHETYRHIKAGERFIVQGEVGDTAYIIQRGSCLVIVEKEGELHPVDHYGEGDIVGGVGLLTGEPHIAHVEAETNVEAWALTRADFDRISERDPEMLDFLTEFVANRFDSRRPTAYRTIGKYIATDIIGRGGFSIVYKGIHATLNMPVAIKMMRHNLAMNADFLDSFRREAKTIAALNHENILRIYDIEERYRTVFIIMEFLEGEGLRAMLGRLKRLPVPLAADILHQTCLGLDYAHRRGIIHRDLNPDNIYLLPGDRVKILDFGLACPAGTEDINLAGTADYISPEQIEGDPVDERTDIYGLGILAYEMVTGAKPFQAEKVRDLFDLHLRKDIPDPAERVAGLPEELRQFIRKASRSDPARRYQHVEEILEEIRPLARRIGLAGRHSRAEKQRMTNLFLLYRERDRQALTRLMEDFSAKAAELGVVLKVSDLHDL
jgi:CRP-like cAMP-binding protein